MKGRRVANAMLRTALATTAVMATGGCTTFGGNVKGSFSCAAPDGICAPSSSIDDRALAMIAAEGSTGEIVPAGPVSDPASRAPRPRTAAAGPRVAIERGDPRRTQERVLRIVFQPYIDELGRLHEASAVHAVVEDGTWQQQRLAAASPIPGSMIDGSTGSLAEAVDRADSAGLALTAIDPNLPDPAIVAAARARAPAIDPVVAIRNDVAARLAPQPDRASRRVVSKSVPSSQRKPGPVTGTLTVAKGAVAAGAPALAMPPGRKADAPVVKTPLATEAVERVKATAAYQVRAADTAGATRDAAASGSNPTKRAAGFPAGVPEDN